MTARRSCGGPWTGAPLSWAREGADWPGREHSRFVSAGGLRWHVQQRGAGPSLLLLHGTGSSTHSWRGLAPLLAEHFTLVAPDLPGHGFSEAPSGRGFSLPGMAASLGELLSVLDQRPSLVVGHSAGAAIACRMSLDRAIEPRAIASVNGALLPLQGLAGRTFLPLARLLALNPLLPRLLAWRAAVAPSRIEALVRDTGSRLDPEGLRLYQRLVRNPGHVAAVLRMMASWDLQPLVRELPRLRPPLVLLVGAADGFVPPRDARRIQALVPGAERIDLPGLGHLAHEEAPLAVASRLRGVAASVGVLDTEGDAP